MKSFGARAATLIASGGLYRLLLVGLLTVGLVSGVAPLDAQGGQEVPPGAWTVEFSESPDSGSVPTFRSEPQPVTMKEAMGAVLVTAESFRLLTVLTESRLAGCQSTRPDLPDARILPDEIADRVGSLNLVVFDQSDVNFTFRTTTDGPEYALTVKGSEATRLEVSASASGGFVLSGTGAAMSVIREKTEMFYCTGAADFTIMMDPMDP